MWSGTYWLGLNDNDVPNDFVYTNGDAVTYTNWGPNQPLAFDPYNCAQVQANGKWATGRCDTHKSEYFCQIKSNYSQSSFKILMILSFTLGFSQSFFRISQHLCS